MQCPDPEASVASPVPAHSLLQSAAPVAISFPLQVITFPWHPRGQIKDKFLRVFDVYSCHLLFDHFQFALSENHAFQDYRTWTAYTLSVHKMLHCGLIFHCLVVVLNYKVL